MKKKVLKIVIGIVVCLYLILIIFTTGFLLNRNDYGVSKFLGKSILLVGDSLNEEYKKDTILFIESVSDEKINEGDKVFFYDTYSTEHKIKYLEVARKEKETKDTETAFYIKDKDGANSKISAQYILGTKESTHAYSFFGKIVSIFQSKWGFLFLVVFPLFVAFLYEIYAIYKEFKKK